MTDDNTLPEGWTQKAYSIGWGEVHYWTENGDYGFDVQDKDEGIRIARALSAPVVSGPTIEDAKAAISKKLDNHCLSGDCYNDGIYAGFQDALNILNNLAPTPEPDLVGNLIRWDLLPEATQKAFRALPPGAVQIWSDGKWQKVHIPKWVYKCTYRQDPDWVAPALTKPDVPWDAMADWVQFVTRDDYRDFTAFERKPKLGDAGWRSQGGRTVVLDAVKIDPGTCDWRESLVERPSGERKQ